MKSLFKSAATLCKLYIIWTAYCAQDLPNSLSSQLVALPTAHAVYRYRGLVCSQVLPHSFFFPSYQFQDYWCYRAVTNSVWPMWKIWLELVNMVLCRKGKGIKWTARAPLAEAQHLMNSTLINAWLYLKMDCHFHRYLPDVPWSSPLWPTCKKTLQPWVCQPAAIHCSWRQGVDPESREEKSACGAKGLRAGTAPDPKLWLSLRWDRSLPPGDAAELQAPQPRAASVAFLFWTVQFSLSHREESLFLRNSVENWWKPICHWKTLKI